MFIDNDGPYYWHIKSGTIQRDPPESVINGKNEPRTPLVKDAENVSSGVQFHQFYFFTYVVKRKFYKYILIF